ncbi:MAG: hypothetical protein AAB390_04675 [Patescibacteria group bacterium]
MRFLEIVRRNGIKITRPTVAVFLIFGYYLANRLYLIWRYGERGFGYDFGIYRHHIVGFFDRLGDPTAPSFAFSGFSNALLVIRTSLPEILIGWYLLISLGIVVFLYALMKKWFNRTAAILAVLAMATSLVQFEFYQWYYYRNLLAVFFTMLALYLFEFRSYLIILPAIVIGSIHPPSFIPFFLGLSVYGVIRKEDRKFLIISLAVSAVAVAGLNWPEWRGYLDYLTIVKGAVPVFGNYLFSETNEFTGQFIDFSYFWRSGLLYFPFAVAGVFFVWRRVPLISILAFIYSLLIVGGFVLYRRYFVYLDIVLIIIACGWLGGEIDKFGHRPIWKIMLAVAVAISIGRSLHQLAGFRPLLTAAEFTAIVETQVLPNNKPLMALSSYYAPWLYGFSNHEVIAPGMFEANRWNREEWMRFWYSNDSDVRKNLFQKYQEKEIYIFMGERDQWQREQFLNDPAFVAINRYLWIYQL